jgi:hypothetical protein
LERLISLGLSRTEVEGFQFQAIVTSFPPEVMDAAPIYRSYLPRGEFENRIKELKQGCALNGFCLARLLPTASNGRAKSGGHYQPALDFDG